MLNGTHFGELFCIILLANIYVYLKDQYTNHIKRSCCYAQRQVQQWINALVSSAHRVYLSVLYGSQKKRIPMQN